MPDIKIALPSVQSLLIHMYFNETHLASGTGFIVNSRRGPVLITNRHNFTGRHQETGKPLSSTGGTPNRIKILHNASTGLGNWIWVDESILDSDENSLWIEHPRLRDKADMAALILSSTDSTQFYPYDIQINENSLHVGPADSLSVIGFPFGMQAGGSLAIWATGFMASEPGIDYMNLPIFLIDCRTRPGQSGSAVVAYRQGGALAQRNGSTVISTGPVTQFLGLYSGRINEQSDLGIVWKATALLELISSI